MTSDSDATTEAGEQRDGIRYEQPAEGVARIVLARPEARNAQDKPMLYALNAAFDRAAHDNAIRVIVLSADGPHFSSGHDLRDTTRMSDFRPVGGLWTALQGAMSLQQLGHSHNQQVHGIPVDPAGMKIIREQTKRTP